MMKISYLSILSLISAAFAEDVTVLGINDMHAEIDYLPKLATCLKAEREKAPNLLLLAAGDNRTGNPYVDNGSRPGIPMVNLMNQLGFDASTLGNHEFDSGPAALREYINAAEFPFICANFFAKDSLGINTKPYIIFERDGVKIGVLGLIQIGENGIPDAHPDQCKEVSFADPMKIAQAYKFLREQCDVLILLTHLGFEDDVRLAKMFPEADAIIGGHTHTRVEKGHIENGVLITQAENKSKYLTRITFDVEDGKVLSKKSELIPLRSLEDDAAMAALVEQTKAAPFFKRQLTTVAKDITRRESLGCMMADAIRVQAETDIGIVNIGNVRLDNFPAGPLLVADVYRLDPFGNDLVRMVVTGKELIELLQRIPTSDHHGAPCVSGMRYKAIKPAAELKPMVVTEACLEDGSPIAPEKKYSLVINTYLCSTVTPMPADPGTSLHTDGAACMIRFLEKETEIDYSDVTRVQVTIQD